MENFDLFANASVDTIDLVPETLRGYYVEDKGAGTFNLKEDIKPLAQALSLSNKAVKELKTKKTDDNKKDANRRGLITGLMGKLTELGIDVGDDEGKLVDVVGTKIAELMDNVKNGKEVKTNIDAIRKDFDKRLATEIGKKDAVLGSMKKSLEKHMIGSAAALALSTSNVIENGVDLMRVENLVRLWILDHPLTGCLIGPEKLCFFGRHHRAMLLYLLRRFAGRGFLW